MRARATLPPAHGIRAMQAISVVILNPWFLGVFAGTAVLCIFSLVLLIAPKRVAARRRPPPVRSSPACCI